MKSKRQITILLALTAVQAMLISTHAASGAPADTLATPESFAAVADTAARSAALFTEAGKVLAHPRCVNCHPAGDRPRQGDVQRLHQPPVARGEDGFGLPANALPDLSPDGQFRTGGSTGQSGLASGAA
jgi:cytochrome c5